MSSVDVSLLSPSFVVLQAFSHFLRCALGRTDPTNTAHAAILNDPPRDMAKGAIFFTNIKQPLNQKMFSIKMAGSGQTTLSSQ